MASASGTTRDSEARQLRRVLNAFLGTAIVVGGAVGVGILRTPGMIAGQLGSPWLIILVWIAGGVLALLGANCLAELAAALPRAGGPYVYCQRAFGRIGGVTVGWGDWMVSMTSMATISVAASEFMLGSGASLWTLHGVAIGLIIGFTVLNWYGLKIGAQTQQWLSIAKLVGIIAIALLALAFSSSQAAPASELTPTRFPGWLVIVSAIMIVSETYAGWNSSVYFSEEDEDAAHNAPRALFWGVAAIMGAYVLFNIGLLAFLPHDVLARSELPGAEVARRLFGESGNAFVRVFAIVSLCGILNVIVMFTPRILYGMSRDGLLPARLSKLNRADAPGMAMIACAVPAVVLAAGLSFETLFAVTAFLGTAINLSTFAAYWQLRRAEPDLERPFRAFGHPLLPLLVTAISAALLIAFVAADPFSSGIGIAAILVSLPLLLRRGRQLNQR